MKLNTKKHAILAALAFAAFAFTAGVAFSDVKVPTTIAEHETLAKQYKVQAAQFKKVADDHREMAEAYKKTVAVPPPSKGNQKNPWLVKMQQHCEMLAKDADKLSVDADKAADYHTLRAKELQGK